MRVSYSGNTSLFQSDAAGSIPVTRSQNSKKGMNILTSIEPTIVSATPGPVWKKSPSYKRPEYDVCFMISPLGYAKSAITVNGQETLTEQHPADISSIVPTTILDLVDAFLAGTKDPLTEPNVTQVEMDIYNFVKSQKAVAAFTSSSWVDVDDSGTVLAKDQTVL
jgi:hypothetical protein